jgi:hypothetical protein
MTPDRRSNRSDRHPPGADWLAAMIRNYIEQDDALKEAGSIVVKSPGDPRTIFIFQRGGDHLMVQVNAAEVVIR